MIIISYKFQGYQITIPVDDYTELNHVTVVLTFWVAPINEASVSPWNGEKLLLQQSHPIFKDTSLHFR